MYLHHSSKSCQNLLIGWKSKSDPKKKEEEEEKEEKEEGEEGEEREGKEGTKVVVASGGKSESENDSMEATVQRVGDEMQCIFYQ